MKTITINKRVYPAAEFDLNTMIDLESLGVPLQELSKKPLVGMRAYVSICMGTSEEIAGNEIQEHVLNGGNMQDIISVMYEQMNDSDFFRKLTENNQTEVTESTPKSRRKNTQA